MPRAKLRPRVLLVAAFLVVTSPFGVAGVHYWNGNIHEVQAGILYRSGQLGGARLETLVEDKGIRTILNLRGSHPAENWYVEETAVALERGISHRSISISGRAVPDMSTMLEIAQVLIDSPKPILVHCLGGSDRSGLAAAIHELVVGRQSEQAAVRQLSISYGHFPWLGSRTGAMDRAFAAFARHWDAKQGDRVLDRGA